MLNVEVHCLILTRDLDEFMAIREELLLRIMDSVAGSGTELAIPSRVIYMPERQHTGQQLESQPDIPPLRYRRA
jgi:MscS family membrane protein